MAVRIRCRRVSVSTCVFPRSRPAWRTAVAALRARAPFHAMTNRRDVLAATVVGASRRRAGCTRPRSDRRRAAPERDAETLEASEPTGPSLLQWYARRIDDARLALDHNYAPIIRSVVWPARSDEPISFRADLRELAGVLHISTPSARLEAALERLRPRRVGHRHVLRSGISELEPLRSRVSRAYQMTPVTVQVGTPRRDASHRFAITLTRGESPRRRGMDTQARGAGRWARDRAPRGHGRRWCACGLATGVAWFRRARPVQAFEPRLTASSCALA